MAERTSEQILDEIVYAVACVTYHYGPSFSESGFQEIRRCLKQLEPFRTDSTFRVDVYEEDELVDFHKRILWPEGWWKLDFDEVVKDSK